MTYLLLQTQGRESIAAKLTANLITKAGADRVLACDLHSGQSMGYFDIFVDHVYGQVFSEIFCKLELRAISVLEFSDALCVGYAYIYS